MKFLDAHTHVHFEAYQKDRDEVMRRAQDARVGTVLVGTNKTTSKDAVTFSEQYRDSWASVGLHPIHANPSFHDAEEVAEQTLPEETFDAEFYGSLAKHKKVVAVGECGLDYHHISGEEEKKNQQNVFKSQILFSRRIQKPLMIHCRDAYQDLIGILRESPLTENPGIIHFFSGTEKEAKTLLDMGFHFTFGGAVTLPPKKNGTDYTSILKIMPLGRILTETDAPYVAPLSHRGRRNEPSYIIEIVEKLSAMKNISLEEMRLQILQNAQRVLNIPS